MSVQPWTGVAGKRVVITGATGGIGLAATQRLVELGADVTIIGRSAERAEHVVANLPRPVDVLLADLASQASVRRLADQILARYPRVDVLVNNAGAIYSSRQLSEDGIELTWAVNHLAAFLLTNLVLQRLIDSAPARIITTSSAAHSGAEIPFDDLRGDRSYSTMGFGRYGQTKLANILFTRALAKRLEGTRVTANCFHPGFVGTGFNFNNGLVMRLGMAVAHFFARSPRQGADTLVWLADSPEVSDTSGGYFIDRRERRPSAAAQDPDAAERLWRVSEEQTAGSPIAR